MSTHNHMKSCTCPDCMRRRDARNMWLVIVVTVVLGAVALCFIGCSSTVVPAPIEAAQASYDEGEANSGILALVDGGALITARARERYNALVLLYGGEFLPALTLDHGIRPATAAEASTVNRPPSTVSVISNEALQKFALLNAWRRMGRAPGKTK